MNKKFVVVKPAYGNVYDYCYRDLENLENIDLLENYITFNSKLEEKIYYKHFTKKMWLPFRSIWNKKYFKNKFSYDDEIYFILCNIPNNIYKYGIVKRLKRKYKNSKVVLFLNDLLKKNFKTEKDKKVLKQFDAVISFDFNDCINNGFIQHSLVYSAPKDLEETQQDIDVFFCGKDKNRFDTILNIFNELTQKGLKCEFLIHGVAKEKRINLKGIRYLDSFMSYEENLNYLKRSKCVLEIMQTDGTGYTLRTCEAIAYNKKLLTDNLVIKDAEFYNEDMIGFIKGNDEIDINFIAKKKGEFKDRNYFSPIHLLEKVINIFNEDK